MISRKGTDDDVKSTAKSKDFQLGEYGDRLIENLKSQESRGVFMPW